LVSLEGIQFLSVESINICAIFPTRFAWFVREYFGWLRLYRKKVNEFGTMWYWVSTLIRMGPPIILRFCEHCRSHACFCRSDKEYIHHVFLDLGNKHFVVDSWKQCLLTALPSMSTINTLLQYLYIQWEDTYWAYFFARPLWPLSLVMTSFFNTTLSGHRPELACGHRKRWNPACLSLNVWPRSIYNN
jgi:hypothetical protein